METVSRNILCIKRVAHLPIGLVAEKIAPHSKSLLGVDVSDKAIELFTERFEKLGKAEEVKAILVDIEASQEGLDGKKFDLIYVSRHHSPRKLGACILTPPNVVFLLVSSL